MTKPEDTDEGFGEIHCYASVYDEIVAKRKAMGIPMAVGKHTAANSKYCKETIEALQATGHHSAADWAIWMLWWLVMDWTTAKQVDEMRVQEIAELRQRIDQLEREKRGIGPGISTHNDQRNPARTKGITMQMTAELRARVDAIVSQLREQSAGRDLWIVRHKVNGGMCVWFESYEQHEAHEWWRDHPGHHAEWELTLFRSLSQQDELMINAANLIEALAG